MLRQLLLSEFTADTWQAEECWAVLAAEFPMVAVQPLASGEGAQVLRLDVEEWRSRGFEASAWDERVFFAADAERLALHLVGARGEELATAALEILMRYQGLVGRRNAASSGAMFEHLLARHRALYDLSRPPSRARYQRALDTWQWVLRLAPEASVVVQVAALFHEVEPCGMNVARLEPDAESPGSVLAELCGDAAPSDSELALLEDASHLSTLSLQSARLGSSCTPRRALERGALAMRGCTLLDAWRFSLARLLPPSIATPEPV